MEDTWNIKRNIYMKKFQPIIKWSGSKRNQCERILEYFPSSIDTYYEPFCGGCSMLMGLMSSGICVKRYVCSDINGDLIALWNKIKESPEEIYERYAKLWAELNKDNNIDRKKRFFEEQRDIYNRTHDPVVFFFLMRTSFNGIVRYNTKGEFNSSFHLSRNGIIPSRILPVLMEWNMKLNKNNVEFRHCSYETIIDELKHGDYVYMDPPYFNTKGLYFGVIDFDSFFVSLKDITKKGVKFAFSFDGKCGNEDNTYDVPESCYVRHVYMKSVKSSFKKLNGKDNNAIVYESLYLNY